MKRDKKREAVFGEDIGQSLVFLGGAMTLVLSAAGFTLVDLQTVGLNFVIAFIIMMLFTLSGVTLSIYHSYTNDGIIISALLAASPFIGVTIGNRLFLNSLTRPYPFIDPLKIGTIELFTLGWMTVPLIGVLTYAVGRAFHRPTNNTESFEPPTID